MRINVTVTGCGEPPAVSGQFHAIRTSALTGDGIAELRAAILHHIGGEAGTQAEDGFLTNVRHQGLVRDSLSGLETAKNAVAGKVPHEMLLLDGERVFGRVTSGGYGYTVRQSIAYGYLPVEYATPGTQIQVQLFGVLYGATVMKEPLFDPKNEKVKA